MLPPPTRVTAWRLLVDLGLAAVLFRFLDPPQSGARPPADDLFSHLAPGQAVPFALAMTAATVQWLWSTSGVGVDVRPQFAKAAAARTVRALRTALRLSNEECEAIGETLVGVGILATDAPPALAARKRFLARPTSAPSRQLLAVLAAGGAVDESRAGALLADLVNLEQTDYAPSPLITGDDLTAAGMRPGPLFKKVLDAVYDAQLEGGVATRDKAMGLAARLAT